MVSAGMWEICYTASIPQYHEHVGGFGRSTRPQGNNQQFARDRFKEKKTSRCAHRRGCFCFREKGEG